MQKSVFLSLFFFFLGLMLFGQEQTDAMKARARDAIYEQPDETIQLTLRILKTEKDPEQIAQLYMLMSNAYISKRNKDSSLYYILKAADLLHTDASPAIKLKLLNSVAVQYQQMELYDKALQTLDQASELITKLPENQEDKRFNSGFNSAVRGMIYRSQANPDLALKKFRDAAENFLQLKPSEKTDANISIIYYNIGYCFIDLDQYAEASAQFKISEKYAVQAKANSLEAYALKGLGESSLLLNNHQESIKALKKAETLAEPVGDLVLNEGIYQLLSSNYLAVKDFVEYEKYNAKLSEVRKNLEQSEIKSISRYLDTQNRDQARNNKELYKRYYLKIAIAFLVAALIAISFFLAARKMQEKNARRKKIIEEFTGKLKIN